MRKSLRILFGVFATLATTAGGSPAQEATQPNPIDRMLRLHEPTACQTQSQDDSQAFPILQQGKQNLPQFLSSRVGFKAPKLRELILPAEPSLLAVSIDLLARQEGSVVDASLDNHESQVVQAATTTSPLDQVTDTEMLRLAREAIERTEPPVDAATPSMLQYTPTFRPQKHDLIMRTDLVDEILAPKPPKAERLAPAPSISQVEAPAVKNYPEYFRPLEFGTHLREHQSATETQASTPRPPESAPPTPPLNAPATRVPEPSTLSDPLATERMARVTPPKSQPEVNPDFLRLVGPTFARETVPSTETELPKSNEAISPSPPPAIATPVPPQKILLPQQGPEDIPPLQEPPVETEYPADASQKEDSEADDVLIAEEEEDACDGCDSLSVAAMIGPMAPASDLFQRLPQPASYEEQGSDFAVSTVTRNHMWHATTMTWISPAFFHKPLYFEQPNLERYGLGPRPIAQPVVSAAHFFGNIPLIPFKAIRIPPSEDVSTLGNKRPGNFVHRQKLR